MLVRAWVSCTTRRQDSSKALEMYERESMTTRRLGVDAASKPCTNAFSCSSARSGSQTSRSLRISVNSIDPGHLSRLTPCTAKPGSWLTSASSLYALQGRDTPCKSRDSSRTSFFKIVV